MSIRVKQTQFYYLEDNRYKLSVGSITGYGQMVVDFNDYLITGEILNPTGIQPAIAYITGIATGIILPGSSSFTWQNFPVIGFGSPGNVYLDYVTGYIQATGKATFDITKMVNGDIFNINGIDFTYRPNSASLSNFEFDTIGRLINILNSGITGGLNDNGIIKNIVGVKAKRNDFDVYFEAVTASGEDSNLYKIYRDTNDINAIKIHSRYFQGGKTLRPPTNYWYGIFSDTFTFTREKSGIYNYRVDEADIVINREYINWVNSFSGNYLITTGLRNGFDLTNIERTGIVKFNNNLQKYYGIGFIPSGQSTTYTGFNINIYKSNPYNVNNILAKYIISGNDFIYSGIIQG